MVLYVLYMDMWCCMYCTWTCGVVCTVHGHVVLYVLYMDMWCCMYCIHGHVVLYVLYMDMWCCMYCTWTCGVVCTVHGHVYYMWCCIYCAVVVSGYMTPGQTPVRDQLSINPDGTVAEYR